MHRLVLIPFFHCVTNVEPFVLMGDYTKDGTPLGSDPHPEASQTYPRRLLPPANLELKVNSNALCISLVEEFQDNRFRPRV